VSATNPVSIGYGVFSNSASLNANRSNPKAGNRKSANTKILVRLFPLETNKKSHAQRQQEPGAYFYRKKFRRCHLHR
jgi:hypothetical protein